MTTPPVPSCWPDVTTRARTASSWGCARTKKRAARTWEHLRWPAAFACPAPGRSRPGASRRSAPRRHAARAAAARGPRRRGSVERPSPRALAPMQDPHPGARQTQREEQLPEQREGRHRLGCRRGDVDGQRVGGRAVVRAVVHREGEARIAGAGRARGRGVREGPSIERRPGHRESPAVTVPSPRVSVPRPDAGRVTIVTLASASPSRSA